jgi:hypothetical protein
VSYPASPQDVDRYHGAMVNLGSGLPSVILPHGLPEASGERRKDTSRIQTRICDEKSVSGTDSANDPAGTTRF